MTFLDNKEVGLGSFEPCWSGTQNMMRMIRLILNAVIPAMNHNFQLLLGKANAGADFNHPDKATDPA